MARLPNIAFLRKVDRGEVRQIRGYTNRRGGYDRFVGGWITYKAHVAAGFVNHVGVATLGRSAVVTLTPAGRQALAAREGAHE